MKDEKSEITRQRLQRGLHIVKRGRVWYVERCVRGRQTRRSLETEDIMEARRRALAGPEELPAPRPFLKNAPKPEVLTLGKALEQYREWYDKNRRASGARRLFPVLEMFVKALGEDRDTRSVTRDDVQRWLDGRREGLSVSTLRGDFGRVRAFIRYVALRKEAGDLNAVRGIEHPRDEEITKEAPSPEKVEAVLRKLRGTWLEDYCRLLAETGMRPTEALGLRGVDLRGKLLSIVPWEGRLLKSKWSRRVIELNAVALGILQERVARMFHRERPIFGNKLGEVYGEGSVYHKFLDTLAGGHGKKVPEELRMTLYDFRHFFCSVHAAPGPQHMEIEALAAYIGHSPTSTQTLLRWYADQRALRRGAPPAITPAPKEGRIIPIKGQGQ